MLYSLAPFHPFAGPSKCCEGNTCSEKYSQQKAPKTSLGEMTHRMLTPLKKTVKMQLVMKMKDNSLVTNGGYDSYWDFRAELWERLNPQQTYFTFNHKIASSPPLPKQTVDGCIHLEQSLQYKEMC